MFYYEILNGIVIANIREQINMVCDLCRDML